MRRLFLIDLCVELLLEVLDRSFGPRYHDGLELHGLLQLFYLALLVCDGLANVIWRFYDGLI